MHKIIVEDKTEYPVCHIRVRVLLKNRCTICNCRFTWDDFWHTIGRSDHAIVRNGICSDCQFWVDNLIRDWRREYAIIDGIHYIIASKMQDARVSETSTLQSLATAYNSTNLNKGMGGAKHIIRFNDGETIITDNLWCQGTIPKHLRQYTVFRDNAIFVG